MDIETRLEELERAHAAGQLDEAELERRRREVLRDAPAAGNPVAAADDAASGSAATDPESAGSMAAVSYTHLDVYKRQPWVRMSSTSVARVCRACS